MSRYIDADALIEELNDDLEKAIEKANPVSPDGLWAALALVELLKDGIDNFEPSIDIVRCKECKHREKYPCNEITFYECSHLRLYGTKVGVEDDWFCADGERRE